MSVFELDNSYLLEPDPEFAALIAANPQYLKPVPDIATLRAARARQRVPAMRDFQKGIVEEDRTVTARDGFQIPIRIHTPANAPEGGSSLFVYYHGGGFCVGDLDSSMDLCRSICADSGAVVVHIQYRLAPEHPFPAGVDDAWDGFKWAAENAASLKANPAAGFIVGGISAGGNFATVVSHRARDEKIQPPLTGTWLSIPALVARPMVPKRYESASRSFEQCADAPILSIHTIKLFLDAYAADPADPKFSPLLWPSGHRELPPTYFQVCGGDPLRDEAFIYENELKEAGVRTKMDLYPGLPHAFWGLAPQIKATRRWEAESMSGYKWLLEQGKTSK